MTLLPSQTNKQKIPLNESKNKQKKTSHLPLLLMNLLREVLTTWRGNIGKLSWAKMGKDKLRDLLKNILVLWLQHTTSCKCRIAALHTFIVYVLWQQSVVQECCLQPLCGTQLVWCRRVPHNCSLTTFGTSNRICIWALFISELASLLLDTPNATTAFCAMLPGGPWRISIKRWIALIMAYLSVKETRDSFIFLSNLCL